MKGGPGLAVVLLLAGACRLSAQNPSANDSLPSSAYLAGLPDGVEKQRFIRDCTGCHSFRARIAYPNGQARSEAGWREAITRMVERFGADSGFPVIGPDRDPAATAAWLAKAMPAQRSIRMRWEPALERSADIREYLIDEPGDLPHDVAIDNGLVAVTGMFTGRMYVLDPGATAFRTMATPEPNPRAVEMDSAGGWWVVLGGPKKVAYRSPAGEWKTFDAGFYAHSIALAPDRSVWVNGHFTHAPELIRRIDPVTGATQDFEVPPHPDFETTTVPYEVRADRAGNIWMSELQGNRLVRFDPRSRRFSVWALPRAAAGARRLDIDDSGVVWIPEYSANRLARFDPTTETFREFELPIKDAAPYVVRYDRGRNALWIGTGAADAVFRFDVATEKFTYYRLSAVDQLVRHLTIDETTGDVWLAPGASPGISAARIIRLRPTEP